MSGPTTIRLTAIGHAGRRYHLVEPLCVQREVFEDGTVYLDHPQLPLTGYGPSDEEAMAAFCSFFDWQYRQLVLTREDRIYPSALPARRLLAATVERIEEGMAWTE